MNFQATLQLQNGIKLDGIGFGSQKVGIGEVVFNTAITGYQEIISDPSLNIVSVTPPAVEEDSIAESERDDQIEETIDKLESKDSKLGEGGTDELSEKPEK